MTSLSSHRHSYDMLAGVLNRTNATLFSPNTEWAQVLRFILAGNADPAVARGQGKLPDIAQIKEIASQVREIAGLS